MGPCMSREHKFDEDYELDTKLGEGAYSKVYTAISRKHPDKKFAVKISQNDKQVIGQIMSEINILREIRHPNIVQFCGFYKEAKLYTVLELLVGGELFDRIVHKKSYTEREARDTVLTLFRAIKYLHDRNIVHRDLKPENLLMMNKNDDTQVKIADFGFAAKVRGSNLTQVCGSPGYIAPEILLGYSYGVSIDMWSLGVIIFTMIGGYPPFYDNNEKVLKEKIKIGQFPMFKEQWGHVSKGAKDLIKGLLTVNVINRLDIDHAIAHPWICAPIELLTAVKLDINKQELRRYQARKRFRVIVKAMLALYRMQCLGKLRLTTEADSVKANEVQRTTQAMLKIESSKKMVKKNVKNMRVQIPEDQLDVDDIRLDC